MSTEDAQREGVSPTRLDRKWVWSLGIVALLGTSLGGAWTYGNSSFHPHIVPGTQFDGMNLGTLSPDEAKSQLKAWWEAKRAHEVAFAPSDQIADISPTTPDELGANFDVESAANSLPLETFTQHLLYQTGLSKPQPVTIKPQVKIDPAGLDRLAVIVTAASHSVPASATWDNGKITLVNEMAITKLDRAKADDAVRNAVLKSQPLVIPLIPGEKHIPDSELAKIQTVIGEFATNFNSPASRANNIKVASRMLNGHVIAPGERFSFNKVLGERTAAKGFQRAGIYLNGKHDFDTGGGICQVSTTLYNTVLQAGLDVAVRQPHSMPVAYVPLGQDATVSYPGLDFAFVNNRKEPVAISTRYKEGRIEFKLLGFEKLPGSVHVENKLLRTFPLRYERDTDPNLPAGAQKISQRGSAGRDVASWRVVKIGSTVRRESLGISHYRGGPQVTLVGAGRARARTKVTGTTVSLNSNQ